MRESGQEQRRSMRRPVQVRGRIFWRDARGVPQVAVVRTRDVSDWSVYVECLQGAPPISLYRLVDLQIERQARTREDLPRALRQPKVSSAIFRVGSERPTSGTPAGYALRLLIEPRRRAGRRSVAGSDEPASAPERSIA